MRLRAVQVAPGLNPRVDPVYAPQRHDLRLLQVLGVDSVFPPQIVGCELFGKHKEPVICDRLFQTEVMAKVGGWNRPRERAAVHRRRPGPRS